MAKTKSERPNLVNAFFANCVFSKNMGPALRKYIVKLEWKIDELLEKVKKLETKIDILERRLGGQQNEQQQR